MKFLDFFEYLRQLALGVGIAILLPLTLHWGFHALYKPPQDVAKSADHLHSKIWKLKNKKSHISWQLKERKHKTHEDASEKQPRVSEEELKSKLERITPQLKELKRIHRNFLTTKLAILGPIDILCIIGGSFFPSPLIGIGLIIGGVASLGTIVMDYWDYFNDMLKFLVLFAGLFSLLILGYILFERMRKQAP